jgi:hypothetical protein
LHYFNTHGGLQTLGYPRTETIDEAGRLVQYFQGGELAYDPAHGSVYPVDLGASLAQRFVSDPGVGRRSHVAWPFASLFKQLGGAGVLGEPVTTLVQQRGVPVQFFQYGELALLGGAAAVVPIGDAQLRLEGWLPASGAADVSPADMMASTVDAIFPAPRAVSRGRRSRASAPLVRNRIRQHELLRQPVQKRTRSASSRPSYTVDISRP